MRNQAMMGENSTESATEPILSLVTVTALTVSIYVVAYGLSLLWLALFAVAVCAAPLVIAAVGDTTQSEIDRVNAVEQSPEVRRLKRKYVKGELSELELENRLEKAVHTDQLSDIDSIPTTDTQTIQEVEAE